MTNAAVLGALKVGAPLCSLLLVLAVSRLLGAEGLGRYSLAYAYLALFSLPGPLGLPTLLTRDGARDRAALGPLLSGAVLLGGGASLLLTMALGGISQMGSYDPATARLLLVVSLAIVPSTLLSYFDAAFLALETARPIAVAALVEHVAKVGLGVAALLGGYGLEGALAAAVMGRAGACAASFAMLRRRGVLVSLRVDPASLRYLAAAAPVFALRAVCATLYWRIDVFLLSHLRQVSEVGYYTAAYRLLDMAILLPQSFCHALYPRVAGDRGGERRWRAAALGWLAALTTPVAATVTLLAGPLLGFLYGNAFAVAAPTLILLIWTTVPYAWNRYHACLLEAADRQRADLAINAGLLGVNVALNLAAIPRYGAPGAAAVTLVTAIVYGAAQLACVKRRPLQPPPEKGAEHEREHDRAPSGPQLPGAVAGRLAGAGQLLATAAPGLVREKVSQRWLRRAPP